MEKMTNKKISELANPSDQEFGLITTALTHDDLPIASATKEDIELGTIAKQHDDWFFQEYEEPLDKEADP